MTSIGDRAETALCAHCNVRLDDEGWLCIQCSLDSDYIVYNARIIDDARSSTATSVSKSHQRRAGDATAYDQYITIVSYPDSGVSPATSMRARKSEGGAGEHARLVRARATLTKLDQHGLSRYQLPFDEPAAWWNSRRSSR